MFSLSLLFISPNLFLHFTLQLNSILKSMRRNLKMISFLYLF